MESLKRRTERGPQINGIKKGGLGISSAVVGVVLNLISNTATAGDDIIHGEWKEYRITGNDIPASFFPECKGKACELIAQYDASRYEETGEKSGVEDTETGLQGQVGGEKDKLKEWVKAENLALTTFSIDDHGDRLNGVGVDVKWAKNDISAKLGGGIKSLSLIHTDEFGNKFYEGEDNEGNKISYYKVGTSFLERQMRNPSGESDKVWQLALGGAIGQLDTKRDFYVELGGTYYKIPRNRIANPGDVLSAHIELVKRWITDHGVFFGSAGFGVSRIGGNNYTDGGFKMSYSPPKNKNIAFVGECHTINSYVPDGFYGQIGIRVDGIFSGSETKVSPYISLGHSVGAYCGFGLEYRIGLTEEPLQEKYAFEKSLKATTPEAQNLLRGGFYDNTAQTTTTQNNDNTQNQAPVWTQSVYNTGLEIRDNTNNPITILNLNNVSSDPNGDTLTYRIVSISVPDTIEQGEWNRIVQINDGFLQLVNLMSEDPDSSGNVGVIVEVGDGSLTNNATINFTYRNLN